MRRNGSETSSVPPGAIPSQEPRKEGSKLPSHEVWGSGRLWGCQPAAHRGRAGRERGVWRRERVGAGCALAYQLPHQHCPSCSLALNRIPALSNQDGVGFLLLAMKRAVTGYLGGSVC